MRTIAPIELGIAGSGTAYRNLAPAQLVEAALRRGEGTLSDTGALVVKTGKYTGRSPNDKFIVDTEGVHNDIAWGKVNRPISREKFNAIKSKVAAYLQGREVFIFDGFAGADKKYTKKFRIVNELASQNMFIHQLLIRPNADGVRELSGILTGREGSTVTLETSNGPVTFEVNAASGVQLCDDENLFN